MILLDFRTLPCPQPVVECRKFLQDNAVTQVQILVDNEAAVENLSRYLKQQGFYVKSMSQDTDFIVSAQLDEKQSTSTTTQKITQSEEKALILITTEFLGQGDDYLGEKLMSAFLSSLPEMGQDLWRIILLNGGVKLAVQQRPALEHLQALENSGVSILVCGTCLQHYGLLKQKTVGDTSNMMDIMSSLQLATKVIRP